MKKIGYLILLKFVMLTSYAADIYVKSGASGDGTSADSPMPYLWRAVERAVRGDVIHVSEGEYFSKGESGSFLIKVPNLTLAGGYSSDFKERNPFKYKSVLKRGPNFKGAAMGVPSAHITGDQKSDHSNLIVDGFILDSTSRNAYQPDGQINLKKSWEGAAVDTRSASVKLRNLTIINTCGEGIRGYMIGKGNEISNCFIINTFYAAITLRAAQPESEVLLKNNTIAFNWFRPGKGGGHGVIIGKEGVVTLEKNVISYIQTEDPSYGHGVTNLLGNIDLTLNGNVFYQCQTSYYKYMDEDNQNLLIYRAEELKDLNENAEDYALLEAESNNDVSPQILPDKDYFQRFASFVGSSPGKLKMDEMNKLRSTLGLNLQAEPGSPRSNYGMAYPSDKIFPNLVSKNDAGAKTSVKIEEYKSASSGSEKLDYKDVEFASFKKGSPESKAFKGDAVKFKGGIGQKGGTYLLPGITEKDYACFKLLEPGQTDYTRNYIFCYILKGSEQYKDWLKYTKRRSSYNKKGLVIKGLAKYIGNDTYSFPVAIELKEISRK